MNLFSRLFRRIRFRRTIKSDQSINVVDGMVKARRLYKELSVTEQPTPTSILTIQNGLTM